MSHLVGGLALGSLLGSVGGVPDALLLLVLLAVALALIFAGRSIIKVVAFIVVGLVGASVGAAFGLALGLPGSLLGSIAGFVLGGLLGLFLVAVGVGVALGYLAYYITINVLSYQALALVMGLVFFVVGVALSGKLLTVVTSILGATLLLDVLLTLNIAPEMGTLIAVLAAIAGVFIQNHAAKKYPTAHRSSGAKEQPGGQTPLTANSD